MDTSLQDETTEVPEGADAPEDENVRLVPMLAPYQFGATPLMRNVAGVPMPVTGADAPVIIVVQQAGANGSWSTQVHFSQNDALDFARRIQQAVKQARGGLTVAKTPLLGADGQAISVPGDATDDLDDVDGAA